LCLAKVTVVKIINKCIASWSSNSGYSLMGSLRALAQTISYEVRLAFILLSFAVLVCRYNLAYFYIFFRFICG
jgi:NADH-ubiquinone oxidoreductase chain 1